MQWHQFRLYNDSNRYQARLALYHAFTYGMDCLVVVDHDDQFIGALSKEQVLAWISSDGESSLAAIANHQALVLNAKMRTTRIRRVMITKRITAVPTLHQGKLVGIFRV